MTSNKKHQDRRSTWPLLRRLLVQYIAKYKRMLAGAVLCMLLVAATTAGNAWIMQPALDHVFLKRDVSMLVLVPIGVLTLAVVNAFASYGQNIIMRAVGQRIIADMQLALFTHLVRADLSMFHDHASGRLISRFTNDIMLMRSAVSTVLTGIARDFFTMTFLIGLMFYQSVPLALIACVVFPIVILPLVRLGRRMRKVSETTQEQLGHFAAQLDETFQGVRAVKAYGREEYEITRASSIIEQLYKLYYKSARVQALAGPMIELITGAAIAGVIWYGGYQVVSGHTTPGGFFSFVAAMIMAYKPAKTLVTLNNSLQEGLAAAARLFEVMDHAPAIQDRADAKALVLHKGGIEFRNVSFHYAPRSGGIHAISLHVPAGKTTALVGASGSGKSTLVNLLLRFYDVDDGAIVIDGQDIRTLTIASLRGAMALVSQDITLFEDTVRANIAYGKLDASEDEIIAAARMAAADEFIRALPQGYATQIGPNGVKLSGGQRQRIAIARAMLKNAPILLLDEATSALDTASERAVQDALEILMRGRTTLVVAHRLSTIRHADVIYVMDKGQVMESGTHESLMDQKGLYSQLYTQSSTGTMA